MSTIADDERLLAMIREGYRPESPGGADVVARAWVHARVRRPSLRPSVRIGAGAAITLAAGIAALVVRSPRPAVVGEETARAPAPSFALLGDPGRAADAMKDARELDLPPDYATIFAVFFATEQDGTRSPPARPE